MCMCSMDIFSNLFVCYGQYLSLCDVHIYDGIAFDVWCIVTTLYMFLCVYLGLVTTLGVEIR